MDVQVGREDKLNIQERYMSGTVPVHSEHVDTNEQVRVQCHVIILNTIEHFCTVQEHICSLFFFYMFTT